MESVPSATVTEDPVTFSVADTSTPSSEARPAYASLLLYFLFLSRQLDPDKGILLLFVLGILGAGPLGLWPSIW